MGSAAYFKVQKPRLRHPGEFGWSRECRTVLVVSERTGSARSERGCNGVVRIGDAEELPFWLEGFNILWLTFYKARTSWWRRAAARS